MTRLMLVLFLLASLTVPAAAQDTPVKTVEVGLFLIDISSIDERAETYTGEFDVIARWNDPDLAYEPVEGEEIPRLYTGTQALEILDSNWSPGIFAVNVLDRSDNGRVRVLVHPDGTVTTRNRLRRTLRAQLDFRKFPFDTQTMAVHIESMVYDSDEIMLVAEEDFTGFGPDFETAEWSVIDLTTVNHVTERVQEKQSYDRLSFLVQLKRHTGYYIWKIMLPIIVIVMLSWIVFYMSEEMLGRRAGISSTGMLTIIAYQFVIAGSLPRFPYLTVLDRFMIVSLLAVAATMLINLMNSQAKTESRRNVDRISRFVFPVAYFLATGLVVLPSILGL